MSNDLGEIKKKIFEEDKIEDIFEAIGCERIKFEQGGTLITAQLPNKFNSSNPRAVQCRVNEGLWCNIRNRTDFEGDIFNLVSFLHFDTDTNELQQTLNKSKIYICRLLHWEHLLQDNGERREDPLSSLKKLMYKNRRKNIIPNKIISENILNDFVQLPIESWLKEGISAKTQQDYGIGFDLLSRRITIPVRNRFGQLIGVKGRMLKDSDVTDRDPKYMYIYRCNQSQEWFNLHVAINAIRQSKEVIIVEGEKSCLKFYEHGIYNAIAIGSSDVSYAQRDIIYNLGLDISIVLAYDSDKTIEEIQKTADMFDRRTVNMIFDRDKLLGKKSAPIDSGIDVWNTLYQNNKYSIH